MPPVVAAKACAETMTAAIMGGSFRFGDTFATGKIKLCAVHNLTLSTETLLLKMTSGNIAITSLLCEAFLRSRKCWHLGFYFEIRLSEMNVKPRR